MLINPVDPAGKICRDSLQLKFRAWNNVLNTQETTFWHDLCGCNSIRSAGEAAKSSKIVAYRAATPSCFHNINIEYQADPGTCGR